MLGAGIDALLPELRAQAESLMTDSCTIDRLTGGSHWDEDLQKTVPTWDVVHIGVPCALEDPAAGGRVVIADAVTTPVSPLVKIPVTFEGIKPDDRVTLASGPVVWVTDAPARTHQVQVRLLCRWIK